MKPKRSAKKWALSAFIGLVLMVLGLSLFVARLAVFPWWYPAKSVGVTLPECTSYQKRVYVYCQNPHESLGLDYTEFAVKQDEGRIVPGKVIDVTGWWIPNLTPRANIILVHGGGADRRAMMKHARYLHEAGFQVALIDCHNHGLSHNDGRGISLGLWESESVLAVSRWIRAQSKLPVFAMGTSQGGFSVLRAFASPDSGLSGVVAENAYVSASRVLLEFPAMVWVPKFIKKTSLSFLSLWLHVPLSQLDVHAFADQIGNRPVLLIHSKNDGVVSVEQSKEIYSILPAKEGVKQLWISDSGEHEFIWNVQPHEYERHVLGFLAEVLAKQQPSASD